MISTKFDINYKAGFTPAASVFFSQLGKKPQTYCHFAGLHPVIIEAKLKGAYVDVAYLIPIVQLTGTKIRIKNLCDNEEYNLNNDSNKMTELLQKVIKKIEQTQLTVDNTSNNVKNIVNSLDFITKKL